MTAPELLRAQMPQIREIQHRLEQLGYQRGTAEWHDLMAQDIAFYRKFVGMPRG